MSSAVERLSTVDFDELIGLLDLSFGKPPAGSFAVSLPALYQRNDPSMQRNYVIREAGRIVANVGLFPMTWQVGDTTLAMDGIGGVAVHPDHRRRGHMRVIMDSLLPVMRERGCQLSYLGGQRQRYGYWGWERCGSQLRASISRPCVTHGLKDGLNGRELPAISLEVVAAPDRELTAAMYAIHMRQPNRCVRDAASFDLFLRNWLCRPAVARDDAGRIVGYAVGGFGESLYYPQQVIELATDPPGDVELATAILRELATVHGEAGYELLMPCDASPMQRSLSMWVESMAIEPAGNWLILDWPAVTDAMLKRRAAAGELAAGRVKVRIVDATGGPITIALVCDGNVQRCERVDESADIELDALTATRVLFGPTAPSMQVALVGEAKLLDAWCPLPLAIDSPDHV